MEDKQIYTTDKTEELKRLAKKHISKLTEKLKKSEAPQKESVHIAVNAEKKTEERHHSPAEIIHHNHQKPISFTKHKIFESFIYVIFVLIIIIILFAIYLSRNELK